MLKGLFKDSHPVVQLLILLVLVLTGALAGQLAGVTVCFLKYGFSMEIVEAMLRNMAEYPSALRELQFFASLGAFVFPAIFSAYLFSDDNKGYLKIDTPVYFSLTIWTVVSMQIALPFLNFVAYFNQQIHFPESLRFLEELLRNQEELNQTLSVSMLKAENTWALILNIVVIGIFAAVGEEFIFRGILQNVFGRFIRNKHVVIWLVAVIFSAIHLQFYGFIPRVLLGAYFGYLLYFTKNMWMPVIAHLVNNLFIILAYWNYGDHPEKLEKMDQVGTGPSWWMALLSLVLFGVIFGIIRRQSAKCIEEMPPNSD